MTENRKIEKGLSLSLVAYLLLEQASTVLREDGKYYRAKTKILLNSLIQNILPVILNIKNLRRLILPKETLKKIEKEYKLEIESDIIDDELNSCKNIFVNLASMYIMADTSKIYELEKITTNLVENKKLYTQEDVLYMINRYNRQINPALKFEDEYLVKNFINWENKAFKNETEYN